MDKFEDFIPTLKQNTKRVPYERVPSTVKSIPGQ